jgi:exosome complex RNA-binding protein Rrp4
LIFQLLQAVKGEDYAYMAVKVMDEKDDPWHMIKYLRITKIQNGQLIRITSISKVWASKCNLNTKWYCISRMGCNNFLQKRKIDDESL